MLQFLFRNDEIPRQEHEGTRYGHSYMSPNYSGNNENQTNSVHCAVVIRNTKKGDLRSRLTLSGSETMTRQGDVTSDLTGKSAFDGTVIVIIRIAAILRNNESCVL